MQGLVVVHLIVEKIWNVNVNCVKANGAQNIGQGHWVNIPAKSGGQGDVCHARYHGCCRIVVDKTTNFDVNVKLRHNRTVNRQTDG